MSIELADRLVVRMQKNLIEKMQRIPHVEFLDL